MCLPGTMEAVRDRIDKEGLPQVSRRNLLVGGAALAAAATLPAPMALARGNGHGHGRGHGHRLQDLTHVFTEGFPVYTFDNPTKRTLVTIPENGFYAQEWTFGEHSGTHMDAPGHFIEDGRKSPDITPRELFAPVVVIDISRRVDDDPDTVVTVDDLRTFERLGGRIPKGAAVFAYSGWESRVGDQDAYRNAGPDGTYHFPGFGIDALEWLLDRRSITCIGVDTLSLDFGASTTFDVHLTLLGADKYGIENLANLKRIPARGATVFVGLIPWEDGSGGPCRAIAGW